MKRLSEYNYKDEGLIIVELWEKVNELVDALNDLQIRGIPPFETEELEKQ